MRASPTKFKCFFCSEYISHSGFAKVSHGRKHVRQGEAIEINSTHRDYRGIIEFVPVQKKVTKLKQNSGQDRVMVAAKELITKITLIIQREDGSEARIVAQAVFGAGLTRSIDIYVHHRKSPENKWRLCSDRPHPDWRTMSIDDYLCHGRSQMLQVVSLGEILKASSAISKPI